MSTSSDIGRLLASTEIIVCCGAGGVGKTSTAAAAGLMAASLSDAKVLVLTVDPARRLATALGLGGDRISDEPVRVPKSAFDDAGMEAQGELWAAMLDTKQSWDGLVRRHAPDAKTRDEILANPLYDNITAKFVQSHDYIAMERLYELHTSGEYDLVIVDTPPSSHAIDFLDAPDRMSDFFSSRLLRWLIAPYRSRFINIASKPFYSVADRILGTQFLSDIAEFFILFQSMYDGFVERAEAVQRVLGQERTSFIVVTTLAPAPVQEADFFVKALAERGYHLGAVVANKVLPDVFATAESKVSASLLRADIAGNAEIAAAVAEELGADPASMARVLAEIADNHARFGVVAQREQQQLVALARCSDVLVQVPELQTDVSDLASLAHIGRALFT